MIWLGGLVLTVLGFFFGRIFNQSELILSDKRRVYEAFLRACPAPNDAYLVWSEEIEHERQAKLREVIGPFLLYASPIVTLAMSRYLDTFSKADDVLSPQSEALHPEYKVVAKAQNDLILEMRRDALAFSAFAYNGKSRLPSDALDQAKRKSLL